MIVVLASRFDAPAARLVASLGDGAALLLARDLSRPGWRFDPDDPGGSVAMVAGAPVACARLSAVVPLLTHVAEHELPHIAEEDSRYVASEMTAFLFAWLAAIPRPVLNRPRPVCLAGPAWTPERWRHEAARCGLRVAGGAARARRCVHVLGDTCVGRRPRAWRRAARRLADAAGVDLLSVAFQQDGAFVSASVRPSLERHAVAAALRRLLADRAA